MVATAEFLDECNPLNASYSNLQLPFQYFKIGRMKDSPKMDSILSRGKSQDFLHNAEAESAQISLNNSSAMHNINKSNWFGFSLTVEEG